MNRTILDLADMRSAADFWQTSMHEQDAWELLRLECQAAASPHP